MATDLSFFRSETAQRLRAQGGELARIEEAARALLTVLAGRGIELSSGQLKVVADTADLDQLRGWLVRAVTATHADELFAGQAYFEGYEEGLRQGQLMGASRSVLAVATARGIELSAAQSTTLNKTGDLDQLHAWLVKAMTAAVADEIFD
ncbi:hypothetical protein ACWFRF_28495 [Nocardia sp. NPDC055165]|uniref:hypothetical protein n=1 Tax=unclassified Nocardia TaxID=2637762 RepID=UPI0036319B4B